MFITTTEEIKAYLPTSVWNKPEGLLSLLEDTEEAYLVPLLGRPLFNCLQTEYKRLFALGVVLPKEEEETYNNYNSGALNTYQKNNGSIDNTGGTDIALPGDTNTGEGGGDSSSNTLSDKDRFTLRILRICQSIDIYMTLANNSGILNVSINSGGGMNSVSADGFDHANKESINRFEKDAFLKAHRAIDRLLLALEEDANESYVVESTDSPIEDHPPYYTSLWKQSRYFYIQHETLFSTATEFNRYVNVDRSREVFITLQADIRYCQDTYLCPEIGTELIETLVASLTDPSLLPADKKDISVWKNTIMRLRTALALFTEARNEKLARKQSRTEADLSLARAKEYISAHQSSFGDYIKDSPLYTPPQDNYPDSGSGGTDETDITGRTSNDGFPVFDPYDRNNAILTFPFIGTKH